MFTDPGSVIGRLIFVGLLIEAVEIVWLRKSFEDNGLMSRFSVGTLTAAAPWHQRIGVSVGDGSIVATVAAVQICAAAVVITTGLADNRGVVAAFACLVTAGFLRMRRQIGGSGAEQLTFIVLVTFALVTAFGGSTTVRLIGDIFIAAQVMLAYAAAGAVKLASPQWRGGGAMIGILSTESYGSLGVATLLRSRPVVGSLMGWAVIAWEMSFVLVLFLPRPWVLVLLAIGAAFHIGCACLMGLNRFVWAFCGCYPAVLVVTDTIRR